VLKGETPIIPVMLGEARRAQDLARALDERGVYVAGFSFPVVPKGAARIRTQMSAALNSQDVDFAVSAFAAQFAGRRLRGLRVCGCGSAAGDCVKDRRQERCCAQGRS
jgi:glycine C-acetyltransferase